MLFTLIRLMIYEVSIKPLISATMWKRKIPLFKGKSVFVTRAVFCYLMFGAVFFVTDGKERYE